MMVFIINHDSTDTTYEVRLSQECMKRLHKRAQAWDLLNEKLIEESTDGVFPLPVKPYRASVVFIGAGAVLKRVLKAQRELNSMDLSVPEYFRKRPELNEHLYRTPVPEE